MRSNCWLVAKKTYWYLSLKGKEVYWIRRKTRLMPIGPHYLIGWFGPTNNWHMISFKPEDKTKLKWYQIYRMLWFKGTIVWGDRK